jgi:hypothetical protein
MTFLSEIIYPWKIMFVFLTFEIHFFQRMSDGEMTKTKVVVIGDICIFPVETFFIWIHLGLQLLIPKSGNENTRGMFVPFSHMWHWSVVVTRETREDAGPWVIWAPIAIYAYLAWKNQMTCDIWKYICWSSSPVPL